MSFQFSFKQFSNYWIFVGVVDHVPALMKVDGI